LFPRVTAPGGTSPGFSWELYLTHREWNALLGVLSVLAGLVVKMAIFPK
jgi:hypothetical protein